AAVQPEQVGLVNVVPTAPFPAAVPWPPMGRLAVQAKPAELQLALAKADLELARQRALQWLISGSREVPSKIPGVAEKVKETTKQRIARYKKKLQELEEIENQGMPAFDQDVWKDNYRARKKDIATERTELLRDLNKPLEDVLTLARVRMSGVKPSPEGKSQRDLPPPEPPAVTTNLDRINFVTRWGLTIVGACLIVGLLTRTSCVAGAAFLLLFYLAMPSLPWLPLNPRAEGHYLFINKNII